MPLAASFAASSAFFGTLSPHAAADRAKRVALPFSSTIGPDGLVKNLVRNEPLRRIFSGVSAAPFTPGFRFEPSVLLKYALPAAVNPPFGSLSFFFADFSSTYSKSSECESNTFDEKYSSYIGINSSSSISDTTSTLRLSNSSKSWSSSISFISQFSHIFIGLEGNK